ncbi:MAG TPA: aminotransferase class V-fold PLP-dependent enzyme [Trebonia sp.]|jgi:selenocysteine lyase/cysteine desulfurase|nr:aminotransferase class V-fold PLP-dependent enzyme [Trebonia sp.]
MADFRDIYPEYNDTSKLDELRDAEYPYLDERGHVYLDYTGAGLAATSQLRAHAARISAGCFGNPHSENPTSSASTELAEQARPTILRHFNTTPDDYAVVFTPNATGACRLVGESYPFGRRGRLVLTADNHNSVNGIREFARARGSRVAYVPFRAPELRISEADVLAALSHGGNGGRRGLFAYPAQSNFTGVQHPLDWVSRAQELGYDVLLDAAAYVPANRLDLSAVRPEFVAVSWYKVFGYPTGVGSLLVRRDALPRLRRPWFSGGTIWGVSVQGGWHRMLSNEEAFEDGTLNFLSIPDVSTGLEWIDSIGIDLIHQRVSILTGWLLENLSRLRHANGAPLVRCYGPTTVSRRGGTVAFNFLDPAGHVVDERAVSRDASAAGISLRTGCFCNPGAGEWAFGLSRKDVRGPWWLALTRAGFLRESMSTVDDYLDRIGLPSGGAVRVSLGLVSNIADVEACLDFAERTYRDRETSLNALAPRLRC